MSDIKNTKIRKRIFITYKSRLLLTFSAIAALFLGILVTMNEFNQIKQTAAETYSFRAKLIEGYVNFYSRAVTGMVHTMQQNMELPSVPENDLKYLKDYSKYNIYGLSGFAKDGGQESRVGTLTGIGSTALLDDYLRREIAATLLLDGQFAGQMEHSSELIWIYYTSARGYIYIAPKIPVNDFYFQNELYKKEFWSQAVPAVNPKLQTIVTSLYDDAAGQGLMITISQPVMLNGNFLGIVSIDMGIKSLQTLLSVGQAQGESILLAKDYTLIARKGTVKLGEKINVSQSLLKNKQETSNGKWQMAQSLNKGWLVLVHQMDIYTAILLALKNTAHTLTILVMVVLLEYLLLRLRKALKDVTVSMNTDPLTKLLNRRGFYSEIKRIYNIGSRYNLKLSVLMLDIDHFKHINDMFGHKEGDKILEEIAFQLTKGLRDSDIVCRWGGEEFVVFLPATNIPNAVSLAERLCRQIENSVKTPDAKAVTVSIGVSEAIYEKTIDWAIDAADKNLYIAKQSGRNRVHFSM